MTAFIYVFLGLGALAYILAPLREQRYAWTTNQMPRNRELARLEQEKRMYLKALKDIEFELASGKVNEGDYMDLEKHYRSEISRVLAEIDSLEEDISAGSGSSTGETDVPGHEKGEADGAD